MTWFAPTWTVASIELRQRVRGVAWYVLLGVFVFVLLLVTGFSWLAASGNNTPGAVLYSTIVFFVLLLGSLVTPALSGNTINGDRDNGTLATMQVTLITTGQLVVGKLLAAWITALAFLLAALPFLLFALAIGGASADTVIISLLILAVELGVVAAIGVGLSGLIRRPLFSIVATYLVVALLSVGTLIAFALGGLAFKETIAAGGEVIDWSQEYDEYDPQTGMPVDPVCIPSNVYDITVPRFDRVWWVLAANPYVLLADAAPTHFGEGGYPDDMFGTLKFGLRSAQLSPLDAFQGSECDRVTKTPEQVIDSTVPGWAVGLALHVLLAAGLILGAWRRTHAPAKRLAAGSRVA